jgi:hypothetical protein
MVEIKSPRMRVILKLAFPIAIALAVIAGTIWYLVRAHSPLGDVEMGLDGWIALILGIVVALALGVGLMRLLYLRNRRGKDEHVFKHPQGPLHRRDHDR